MVENSKSDLNILYISSVCSEEVYVGIQKHAIKPTQFSIQKFHTAIIKGFSKNKNINVQVLSGRPISRKNSKKILFKKIVSKNENVSFTHIGFINFKILKHLCISFGMIKNLISWNRKNKNTKNKIIICDGAYVSVAPFIVFLAKKMKIKKVAIVADIFDYMSDKLKERKNTSKIRTFLANISNYCWNNYDGYVLLTEKMNDLVNPKEKPYIVMEGIANIDIVNINTYYSKEDFIMYAGGLNKKHGLKNLIDAFNLIKNPPFELHLYGNGDMVNYIKEISKNNNKIKYMGVRDNSEIVEIEKKATLLINPRPTKDEFTLYSFPSKTIEYMLTGTPVLMTQLPGMPNEYYKYIYLITDESVEGIKEKILEISKMDKNELIKKGKEAQQFVVKNKNNFIQSNRIIELLKNILR